MLARPPRQAWESGNDSLKSEFVAGGYAGTMILRIATPLLLAGLLTSTPSLAQNPDIIVSVVGSNNSWSCYGSSAGMASYEFDNTTCNIGDVPVDYHVFLVENLYQVIDGRIRQLGAGFAVPKSCAINQNICGQCQPTNCTTLGIGCADTSAVNDGALGTGRWRVNASTGNWNGTPTGPCCEDPVLAGRVFAPIADLEDPAGRIIAESLFLNNHDQVAGNGANNASWTEMLVPNFQYPNGSGVVAVGEPAIYAWKDRYPDVQIEEIMVLNEGGPGVHGILFVGSRATDLGNGTWRYDYAIQNLTSERGVASLTVNSLCSPQTVSQMTFSGPPLHSGTPYDSTDWTPSQVGAEISWSTTPFATDPNANALRWGTLSSFSFENAVGPAQGTVELGLFQPGSVDSISSPAIVPQGAGFYYPSFCTALPASQGVPVHLAGSGSPLLGSDDLQLTATLLPPLNFGYFLMADGQALIAQPPGSQGNLCLGGSLYRFNRTGEIQFSGAGGFATFHPIEAQLPGGAIWLPGSTWNFQYWTRDTGQLSNFSNLATITFCN